MDNAAIVESAMILRWARTIGWLGQPRVSWIAGILCLVSLSVPWGPLPRNLLFVIAVGLASWGGWIYARERARKRE